MEHLVLKKLRSFLKITSLFLLFCTLSSCAFLTILAGPTSPEVIIKKLELDADWRGNLLGSTVVEGKVKNRHYNIVSEVKLRANVYDNSLKLIEQYEFTLPVSITPDGEATFKEYVATRAKYVYKVDVEIFYATD